MPFCAAGELKSCNEKSGLDISTWVFLKIGGTPPKWMVKIMETPIF